MIRRLCYLPLVVFFLLLQVSFFPFVLPDFARPELLLLFVLYLSVAEDYPAGAVCAWLTGCLFDVYGGIYLGLHAVIFLLVFLLTRWAMRALNAESPLLLLLMVFCGSLLQAGLLLVLGIFADFGRIWLLVAQRALFQAGINVVAAFALLELIMLLQRRFAPRLRVPGLEHLDEPHGA